MCVLNSCCLLPLSLHFNPVWWNEWLWWWHCPRHWCAMEWNQTCDDGHYVYSIVLSSLPFSVCSYLLVLLHSAALFLICTGMRIMCGICLIIYELWTVFVVWPVNLLERVSCDRHKCMITCCCNASFAVRYLLFNLSFQLYFGKHNCCQFSVHAHVTCRPSLLWVHAIK